MGSGTYFVDPVKPVRNHLFIVVTRTPARFNDRSNPGMLEFTDEEPSELIKRFEKEEKVLIVGGPQIATLFLKENLVDELWLTFEPKIFGTGKNFATGYKLDITLELISCEKSNPQGTLITKYRVV